MVLNSLNFCLSEKFFISPSILNEILARYSSLGCRFFPFSTLNISCHSLLACRVSAERSAVNHMGFPLYITCCFSLAAFNILSLCLVFVSLVSVCLEVWSGFIVDKIHMGLVFVSISQSFLLVGVFNPFTFKVIIDIFAPIAIFLIVWSWFCRSFFFSYISWLYKSI